MWNALKTLSLKIVLPLLLAFVFCFSQVGYTKTTTEMTESITIPMQQWQTLTAESKALSQDLIEYKKEIQLLKKPSAELVQQLTQAEKMLSQLQTELEKQKKDLTELSKDKDELKTSLQTLKQKINKERAVHRRQVWQNRIWCLLIGAGIGVVASR